MITKPLGYQQVTASLIFKDASKAIDFYKDLFGAEEKYRLKYKGKVVHAEIFIGDTMLMLADEMPEMGSLSAETIGNTPIVLYVYVDNVDATFERAIKLGAKALFPVKTQFYGDRVGAIVDPFGFKWSIATKVKDVAIDYIKKNMDKMMGQMDTAQENFLEKYLKYKQKYLKLKKNLREK